MKRMVNRSSQELKDREEKVLKWLVRDYAVNGHPVGSSRLVAMDYFSVGSATLRHVLSDLEGSGYLLQPHTSAGRIPTDKGYRYFVDRLMELERPQETVTRDYETGLENLSHDLDQLIRNTAQFLGDMSHALVLISKPQEQASRIRSIALHELDRDSVLLIVHMSLEQVKTVAFEIESQISRIMLHEAEIILNDLFAGREISDVQQEVSRGAEKLAVDNPIIQQILRSFSQVLDTSSANEFRTYGTHQLLHYPEMAEHANLEFILESIEKENLQSYLPKAGMRGRSNVFIGRELGHAFFNNMSLISLAYRGANCSGEIHILGPTRMEYERIIGLAEFTADKIETLINTKYIK